MHDTESLFVHCIIQSNIIVHYCYKGDTSFSTLVQQSHKSLVKYYTQRGRHLYNPDESPQRLVCLTTSSLPSTMMISRHLKQEDKVTAS